MSEQHHTESSMTRFLEKKYAPPHYAFLSQVRNGTGFQRRTVRTADGIAMSLWPSRGIHLNGFEIKVSRSDFNHEIANPEKAEDIAQHCHYWWVVAPNTKVAPRELVPGGWGLLVLDETGEKLVVEKEAQLNTQAVAPDFLLLAAILRNASDSMVPKATLVEHREAVMADLRKAAADDLKSQTERLGKKYAEYVEKERKLREVFDDYNNWDTDGFLARYKLAKRLKDGSRQLTANLRLLVDGAERLKPILDEVKAATEDLDA